MKKKYYDILLPIPKGGVYTYSCETVIDIGQRVVVEIGRRETAGIVIKEVTKPNFSCKDILLVFDEQPLFSLNWIKFILSLSEYYSINYGLALQGVISNKLLNIQDQTQYKEQKCEKKYITLTTEQKKITDSINLDKFSRHLIHGITGSGKTEVYLEIAKKVINLGKQVYYIVPEISLTPQLIERITSRLGFEPVIFHSKLNNKKREEAFFSFSKGLSKLLIGARSSLFIPSKDMGLIIIDEEHEQSFKQDESPSYHLRDMAVLYGSIANIPVLMGSATPSVESIKNSIDGKYQLHKILDRPNNAVLPKINIIDIKQYDLVGGMIAEPLYDKLSESVSKGEQAIIFLNRKGYSTSLFCKKCGEVATCINCSVGLVYYKSKGISNCKFCNTDYKYLKCHICENNEYIEWGVGTEKVEEFLESMFPNKVLRVDMENISTLKQLKSSIKAFEKKEKSILVGTQLIAKGLHFPNVTFVGILGIDTQLAMHDFRATERAYQLLLQVAGRAGREGLKGNVYVQTVNPNSPIFNYVQNEDNEGFYQYELARRKITNYPPFSKMAKLLITHTDNEKCWNMARDIVRILKSSIAHLQVLGPAIDRVSKIKNRYRISILLKSSSHKIISDAILLSNNIFESNKYGSMLLKIDKDPYKL